MGTFDSIAKWLAGSEAKSAGEKKKAMEEARKRMAERAKKSTGFMVRGGKQIKKLLAEEE